MLIGRELARMRPDPTRQKIALFGNFGTGNLGNDATLQAMVLNLRSLLPNAEISCVCPGPEQTARQQNISAIPMRAPFPIRNRSGLSRKGDESAQASKPSPQTVTEPHRRLVVLTRKLLALTRLSAPLRTIASLFLEPYRWFKAITWLKKSNLLIMTGTGMLGDYAIMPFELHYDILRWAVIAKLCRCKLLFVSVGGGPIRHPLSRFFIRAALALADYRSYRDASSKDYLEAIGADVKNDPVYPDLAFSLPKAIMPASHDAGRQGVVIGVGLLNYYSRSGHSGNDETIYHDYVGCVASVVVRLLRCGYTVRVLIGDVVCDQGVRQELRRVLEDRGLKYEDGRIIDEPASSVEELLSQLASLDVVVSSRFHNLLLALMLGKPVVAISYHEKFQPLMNGVGLAGFCQDIENVDVDDLIGQVIRLQENATGIKLQIERKTEIYRAALDEQYERILNVSRAIGTKREADRHHKWGQTKKSTIIS